MECVIVDSCQGFLRTYRALELLAEKRETLTDIVMKPESAPRLSVFKL